MKRPRYVPKVFYEIDTQPFLDAEEAWFWFVRCEKARRDGARFREGLARALRPCDPDDIYRAVLSLYRSRRLRRHHVDVLNRYGFQERVPDGRCRDEEKAARHWDEAMDRLSTVLKSKGLIL